MWPLLSRERRPYIISSTSHPSQLSLAILWWVGANKYIQIGSGLSGITTEENGEFCVAEGTITRTTGLVGRRWLLTELAIWPMWVVCWLNWV